MLQFVAHEARHAYQWESFNNPGRHIVSNRTMDRWRENWLHNLNDAGWPDPDHVRQPIEWDAYYFTDQITRNQFGRPDYYLNWYSPWPH